MAKNAKKENLEIKGVINGHNKKYTFDKIKMDLGEYLNLLNIKPYDKVIINNIFLIYNNIYN